MQIPQFFETLWADVKFAARGLRKSPGFLAVVVVSLALGIAANSTIFSVLNALLFRPLPYPQPESLVVIWQTDQAHPDSTNAPPIAENVDWTKQILGRTFQADEQQDLSQAIVISTPFWKREYNGDPHVLGKTLNVEGVVSTIVGVM